MFLPSKFSLVHIVLVHPGVTSCVSGGAAHRRHMFISNILLTIIINKKIM